MKSGFIVIEDNPQTADIHFCYSNHHGERPKYNEDTPLPVIQIGNHMMFYKAF